MDLLRREIGAMMKRLSEKANLQGYIKFSVRSFLKQCNFVRMSTNLALISGHVIRLTDLRANKRREEPKNHIHKWVSGLKLTKINNVYQKLPC